MIKKNLITILLVLISFSAFSQRMIFRRDSVSYTPRVKKWGRNAPNMLFPYVQLNWALGPQSDGARLHLGHSVNFRLGLDYKRKITRWFHIGVKLQYATETFRLVQDYHKVVPDTILHQSEGFNLQSFVSGGFLRFNLGKQRISSYGIYIETGVNHVWAIRFFHVYNEELPGGESQQTRTHNLAYTLPNYGEAYVKFGWTHIAAVTTVRFTPLFRTPYGYPDMPIVKLGMEAAF